MTKVRTVIPMNAKPGKSVIQVINPSTNKPVRARVPKDAIPGQTVELDIPEDGVEGDHGSASTERSERKANTPDRRPSDTPGVTERTTPEQKASANPSGMKYYQLPYSPQDQPNATREGISMLKIPHILYFT